MAEMEGFEPSDDFRRHTISNRARYDRFDTSPNIKLTLSIIAGLNRRVKHFLKVPQREKSPFAE